MSRWAVAINVCLNQTPGKMIYYTETCHKQHAINVLLGRVTSVLNVLAGSVMPLGTLK